MKWIGALVCVFSMLSVVEACSDFYMNFTNFKLSARTLDLGTMSNWTITKWPRFLSAPENAHWSSSHLTPQGGAVAKRLESLINWPSKFGTLGVSANWIGDERFGFPIFFGESLNEKGLSCSLLTLVDTQYEDRDSTKENVFAGTFCHYIAQNYESVVDIKNNLENMRIFGPDLLAQHFIIRDANGLSLVIEMVGGQKKAYLDTNDGKNFFGITTNEPTLDWHLENVRHYQWKRTLARQSVAIPGNFYPEERFLRVHMIRDGMQTAGLMAETTDYQVAVGLTAQVLNSVTVPQGNQYGTDSGDSSGEGDGDHTSWAVIRDHATPALYW
jgi:penicillin V acylase-like amidase (Ntn superfamily)